MEFLGEYRSREIYYINVRKDEQWHNKIPSENWVTFVVANNEDKELVIEVAEICLDKKVCYICGASELASIIDDAFDLEIVKRAIIEEEKTGIPYD